MMLFAEMNRSLVIVMGHLFGVVKARKLCFSYSILIQYSHLNTNQRKIIYNIN